MLLQQFSEFFVFRSVGPTPALKLGSEFAGTSSGNHGSFLVNQSPTPSAEFGDFGTFAPECAVQGGLRHRRQTASDVQ